jgi:hypothetical protein
MDTLSRTPATPLEPPLTESGQAALRDEVLHRLARLPFPAGALIKRSLWLITIGPWGSWTRAVVPVDGNRDQPEPEAIAGWCDLIATFMERGALLDDDDTALIVLRRPGTASVSDADERIFRVLRGAVACRDTVPWAFYVATQGSLMGLPLSRESLSRSARGTAGSGGVNLAGQIERRCGTHRRPCPGRAAADDSMIAEDSRHMRQRIFRDHGKASL